MKISKSLLQAILVGVTIGSTATSCDQQKKDNDVQHLSTCAEDCKVNHQQEAQFIDNCPACGMG